jgi:flagellar motor switch protein FliN
MASIPTEVISKLSSVQEQIWDTVSQTVSEASGKALTFGTPLTVAARTQEIYSEIGAPMLVIQFAFASLPDNAQVVLIPQDTAIDLATLIKGELVAAVDENLVADIRPTLEGIVQGICLSVGELRNEPMVASGLSIRFQILNVPNNLQKVDEAVRTQIAITGENVNGTAIWIMDNPTAQLLLGVSIESGEENVIFAEFGGANDVAGDKGSKYDENNPLDLLRDIPLQISVELGRVKMMVKDVVELGTGSIIEIDKAAGEPVDVLVNGRVVARGEVVVIEDNFGVRITEILNPQERMNRLSEVA